VREQGVDVGVEGSSRRSEPTFALGRLRSLALALALRPLAPPRHLDDHREPLVLHLHHPLQRPAQLPAMSKRSVRIALFLCDTPNPLVLEAHGTYLPIFTSLLADSLCNAGLQDAVNFRVDACRGRQGRLRCDPDDGQR
jgi:hypothetical protein